MKVVIDTNIFVSSLYGGKPREIIGLWKKGRLILCVTQDILDEYFDVMKRFRILGLEVQELLHLFAIGHSCFFAGDPPRLHVVESDPTDNKFFECAVATKAKIIVSGDKKILAIKKYVMIEVCSAKQFLERIDPILF